MSNTITAPDIIVELIRNGWTVNTPQNMYEDLQFTKGNFVWYVNFAQLNNPIYLITMLNERGNRYESQEIV